MPVGRLVCPYLALQCLYQYGREPRAVQSLSTHAEKCSDLEKDSSFPMFLQGQGSDVPLPKKQECNFIPGSYGLAFLHSRGAF